MVLGKDKKEVANAAGSSLKMSLSEKKTSKSLKPGPKIVKKSQKQNSAKTKETKNTSPYEAGKEDGKKTMAEGGREHNINGGEGKKLNSPNENKEKKAINENHEEQSQRDQKTEENPGGLIFMCNTKTKPDCFHYQVMGVPTAKRALVMGIQPGLKLFLYDFDLKLMYGIYKASSAGGMKLEPAAFGGAFPVQVRFKVHKECLPLPESVFKKAIKDNYDEKAHKFKTELTVQQVKKLTELFRPVPQLRSNTYSFVQEPQPIPIICHPLPEIIPCEEAVGKQVLRDHYTRGEAMGNLWLSDHETEKLPKHTISTQREMASPDPLFLTEKEYRSFGLQWDQHVSIPATGFVAPTLDPYRNGQAKEQLLRNPGALQGDAAATQNEAVCLDPLFLSEKDYRAYGLGVRRELPSLTAHTTEITASARQKEAVCLDPLFLSEKDCRAYGLGVRRELPSCLKTHTTEPTAAVVDYYPKDPYYPHHYGTALLDPNLTLPRMVAAHSQSYSLTIGRESYINDSKYIESPTRNYSLKGIPDDTERPYSTYASQVLSDHNKKDHHLGGQPDLAPTSVSSRYSFAGPSLSYR